MFKRFVLREWPVVIVLLIILAGSLAISAGG